MKKNKICPTWVKAAILFAAISIIVYFTAVNFHSFADLVNSTVSVAIRIFMSSLTYIFPFSVFELLIISLLPIAVLLTVISVKQRGKGAEPMRVIFSLFGIVSLIFSSYVFMLGVGYRTTPLADRIGIEDSENISKDELYRTVLTVRDELNYLADRVSFDGNESVMPYSVRELSAKIVDAYDTLNREYDLVTNFESRAKPVYFSTVMSDLRITGIYSFFTGEANVNVEYPDYGLPFTVAHEMAHQRGICRENEANFVAFLVCIGSDDEFIRYSGYLNLYEYLASALIRADRELYLDVLSGLSEVAISDIRASNAVYNSHKDSPLGEINEKANDTYLKLNGTQGTVSYGYVVRLAVSYYEEKTE